MNRSMTMATERHAATPGPEGGRGGSGVRAGALLGIGIVVLLVAVAVAIAVRPLAAQESPWRLSLDEAVTLARTNNPVFRQAQHRMGSANWGVREARSQFLPTLTTNAGIQYVGAGTQRFGIFTGEDIGAGTTDYFLSDYSLNLGYSLDGGTFFRVASSKADRAAARAGLRAAGYDLEAQVTQQYLTALRARDGMDVARRQLERAEENYELASARVQAGAVPGTDARQAEVERGRAEVGVIQAENDYRAALLGLLEQIGVPPRGEVVLVSEFQVFEPGWDREALVASALDAHPQLRSFEATEEAGEARLREAQGSYLPSLSFNAQWSGFTRELGNTSFLLNQARGSIEGQRQECQFFNQISSGLSEPLDGYPQDCSQYTLTSTDEARILQGNDQFPFNFEQQPLSMSLRVSVPVFQGFTRQRRVEEARVQARNAEENRRAEELRLRTVVTRAYGNLEAAHRIVTIEERNRQVAEQQLELARERYRMGAAPFLELLDAQSSMATADRDYLNALYDFHGALAQLEQASGRDLRPETAVREVDRPGSSVPTGDGSGGDSGSHPEEAR